MRLRNPDPAVDIALWRLSVAGAWQRTLPSIWLSGTTGATPLASQRPQVPFGTRPYRQRPVSSRARQGEVPCLGIRPAPSVGGAAWPRASRRVLGCGRLNGASWPADHPDSIVSLIGRVQVPRPGEGSLAHHGILFLDELPEFKRHMLEGLRQPLERLSQEDNPRTSSISPR
jgi:Magnesium chelatase, subunit ChlI